MAQLSNFVSGKKELQKRLKLKLLKSIKDNNRLPKDFPKSKAHYHLKPFILYGLVKRIGYGTWEITDLGKQVLSTKELQKTTYDTPFVTGKKELQKIRGHGFMWTLKLPSKAYLNPTQRKTITKGQILKNNVVKATIRGHNVHFCLRSVVIYFNKNESYIGSTANDSYKLALYEFQKIIQTIENIYNTSLRINKYYKFKLSKQHYGHLNNEFAVHYHKKGKFLRVEDKGKEWLIIDFSSNQYIEMETTDSDRAKYDMDTIITPTMNTLRHDPKILERLNAENEQMKAILETTQKAVKLLLEERDKSIAIDRFKY